MAVSAHVSAVEVAPTAASAALLERLNEPATTAALEDLLDSVGTLSGLLTVAGSFFARGDEVIDNVASSYHELAGAASQTQLLTRLTDPAVVELLSALLGAVSAAKADVAADPAAHQLGLRGIARVTKDPDVRRGLGFTFAVMKELGRALDPARSES